VSSLTEVASSTSCCRASLCSLPPSSKSFSSLKISSVTLVTTSWPLSCPSHLGAGGGGSFGDKGGAGGVGGGGILNRSSNKPCNPPTGHGGLGGGMGGGDIGVGLVVGAYVHPLAPPPPLPPLPPLPPSLPPLPLPPPAPACARIRGGQHPERPSVNKRGTDILRAQSERNVGVDTRA
jgi:hypothetical protein